MARVVHFEISADDPEKLAAFYADVFGWGVRKWDGPVDYWLLTTGPEGEPGIDGAIQRREDPAMQTLNYIDVPSVDTFIEKVQGNGGTVVLPKTAIPGVGYVACCLDPQGNPFGLMESHREAG